MNAGLIEKITLNVDALLDRMQSAAPEDAVRFAAAVKSLAGSIAELKTANAQESKGLRQILEQLNRNDS
jgi:hypothetical protein